MRIGKKLLVYSLVPLAAFLLVLNTAFYFYSPEFLMSRAGLPVLSLAIIVIAFAVTYITAKKLSEPIKELRWATEQVEKGDFETRVYIESGDEIERLGRAFNKTTAALARINEEHGELEKAKSEFLSITSHELRSPMTPMEMQLQMLQEGDFGKLNKKQKESVDIVLRNTKRLDKIIQDFLEISRVEAARLKFIFVKTNLVEHITRTVDEMKGFMPEKEIEISAKIGKLPVIEADPDRVMQVLRNLINNAVKFSPPKSKIMVSARRDGKNIIICVKDTGKGIIKENEKRIFEPFFQEEGSMRRQYGGTGLGLTICKGIVESQKGMLWVESREGQGSKFCFSVPLKPVRKTKPIRMLFSPQKEAERKVKELFKEMLGEGGAAEFKKLKNKKGVTKENSIAYLDSLVREVRLQENKAKEFRNGVDGIFGEKNQRE